MKHILYILIALTLVGCKKSNIDKPTEGEVLILVNASKITVTSDATKALSIDGFNKDSKIGLFSQVETTSASVDLVTVRDNNYGYSFVDFNTYLTPYDSRYVVYFYPQEVISLFAYHPFSETATNAKVKTDGDKFVDFELIKQQNTSDDLLANDLMHAMCKGIYEQNKVANLEFTHKLCKVSFRMLKGQSWDVKVPMLTKVAIKGKEIPTKAKMRIFDGSITTETSDEDVEISWNSNGTVAVALSETANPVDVLVLPFNAKNCVFEFVAEGRTFRYNLPETNFNGATNVEYTITLNNSQTFPVGVEVSVNDWEVHQNIHIKPN